MRFRAVLFDLGGVVLGSPLQAIAEFELETGLPRGFIGRVIEAGSDGGAWSLLDRGELRVDEFRGAFARECQAAGQRVDTLALMERIGESSEPRHQMLRAIDRIRAEGLRAAALTNNWAPEDGQDSPLAALLAPYFDAVFESSVLGMRKPDPRIYTYACRELHVKPPDAIFLDDIGANLKTARALGMYTIKVGDPGVALAELSSALGFPLD